MSSGENLVRHIISGDMSPTGSLRIHLSESTAVHLSLFGGMTCVSGDERASSELTDSDLEDLIAYAQRVLSNRADDRAQDEITAEDLINVGRVEARRAARAQREVEESERLAKRDPRNAPEVLATGIMFETVNKLYSAGLSLDEIAKMVPGVDLDGLWHLR